MLNKAKIIWIIFCISLFLVGFKILNEVFLFGFSNEIINFFVLLFPILLLILHSLWTLGIFRAIIFIFLATIIGLLFEIWGLNSGVIFGGHYVYEQSSLMLFKVPYIVPIYWAVFVYTSYCISNSFLSWMNKNKPSKYYFNFLLIPLLVFFDGIFTVIIDLIMDPLQVKAGAWTWLDGGSYFDIPIGNFVGWFIVTIVITGIYRLFEYYYPKSININKSVFLIPVLGYAGLSISFMINALYYKLYTLSILSLILMLPIIIVNIILIYTIFCSCTDQFWFLNKKTCSACKIDLGKEKNYPQVDGKKFCSENCKKEYHKELTKEQSQRSRGSCCH